MSGRLNGKVAFITGTGGGQGRAAAILFAQEGAKVVGCDVKKEGGEETAEIIKAAGGDSIFRVIDLGEGDDVKNWFDWGVARYGQMDILYNNAGARKATPIEHMTWDDWQFTIHNELDLIFWACHHSFPLMKSRGGCVINTASRAGMLGEPTLGNFAHSATKGGVIALTRQLAAEGAKYNIRSNSISPGLIETPATTYILNDPAHKDIVDSLMGRQLLKHRWGQPKDIAYCALYLASDEAEWITGANFVIDGGIAAN